MSLLKPRRTALLMGLAVLVVVTLAFVAAGCGSAATTTTIAPATTVAPATTASTGSLSTESSTTASSTATTTASKPIHVAVINQTRTSEALTDWANLFEAKAKALGWTYDDSDANGDFNKLLGFVDNAISQKVDAVVSGFWDLSRTQPALQKLHDAGIPVFLSDSPADPLALYSNTSDDHAIGAMIMDEIAKLIGEKGNVYMFTFDEFAGTQIRAQGGLDELTKYPNIKLVQKLAVQMPGDIPWAHKAMQDLLTASPAKGSIAGVFGLFDEVSVQAAQVCDAAGRNEVAIVGADGTNAALTEMKTPNSALKATVQQDWDAQTTDMVQVMSDYLLKGIKPAVSNKVFPGKLITQESVQAGTSGS